jgi:hypothetical protein
VEKICYILGAGFSAPLGLPVINNFLLKSKDMYFDKPTAYEHFKVVFDKINEMAVSKNYYATDLFDIEEILSILEMNAQLEGEEFKDQFLNYIRDVIKYYTPQMKPFKSEMPINWFNLVFGYGLLKYYGVFIGNFFNMKFHTQWVGEKRDFYVEETVNPRFRYSIVTLNYDMIPELVCAFVNDTYKTVSLPIAFSNSVDHDWTNPVIAKLHGSVDSGIIVPPTWSKGVHSQIIPEWIKAYDLLKNSTHIRVIGYSLPSADAYVKYLLKSAVLKSSYLKSIDVLCLDPDSSVKRRYDEFIQFKYYRFIDANVLDYLTHIDQVEIRHATEVTQQKYSMMTMNHLEDAHNDFFNR